MTPQQRAATYLARRYFWLLPSEWHALPHVIQQAYLEAVEEGDSR